MSVIVYDICSLPMFSNSPSIKDQGYWVIKDKIWDLNNSIPSYVPKTFHF